jgi:arginyl-tRNA synthetase
VFLPEYADQSSKPAVVIIKKSDGGFNYATTDLAAIRYRVQELNAERVIYVVDARQRDHFRNVFAIARKAGWDVAPNGHHAELKHVAFGAVLGEDKKPLKTRSGENVTLKSLLDEAVARGTQEVRQRAAQPESPTHGLSDEEILATGRAVGIGAVKYADLSNDLIRDYVFNLDRMVAFEGNTGPYMQYAHARICSIFAKAGEAATAAAKAAAFIVREPAEKQLALVLLRYGDVVRDVARSLEPHRLCTYLFELANMFNTFYQQCPVLIAENPAVRASRLRLCDLTRRVLADGLDLLGIESPRRM